VLLCRGVDTVAGEVLGNHDVGTARGDSAHLVVVALTVNMNAE
jgi:hypothetical protein